MGDQPEIPFPTQVKETKFWSQGLGPAAFARKDKGLALDRQELNGYCLKDPTSLLRFKSSEA